MHRRSWCLSGAPLNSLPRLRLQLVARSIAGLALTFFWQGLVMPFNRLLFLVPVAVAALSGCASNPVTGTPDLVFQSEAGEIKKSKEVHPMLLQQFGGQYEDQQIAQYVNEVGQRAAKASQRPELTYTFTVLDSEEINAFTTGGGYVYITRGILKIGRAHV